MTALQAIEFAQAAGVTIEVSGDRVLLKAKDKPPPGVLDLLRHHKPAILKLLKPHTDEWCAQDWRAFFDERASILEHDQGMSQLKAESVAYECCFAEWINQNPPTPTDPNLGCAWCGRAETDAAIILPYGAGDGAVWLHSNCWQDWYQKQKTNAHAALAQMGIGVSAQD